MPDDDVEIERDPNGSLSFATMADGRVKFEMVFGKERIGTFLTPREAVRALKSQIECLDIALDILEAVNAGGVILYGQGGTA